MFENPIVSLNVRISYLVWIDIKGNTKIIQNFFHRKNVCFKRNVKILLKNLFYAPYFWQKIKELTWFVTVATVFFNFVFPCIISISQTKHQLDATLCRFYLCRVTLHVSGVSAHHQEYLKLVQRSLVHVLSLQVSHHISLLGRWWWALAPETCRVTLQK